LALSNVLQTHVALVSSNFANITTTPGRGLSTWSMQEVSSTKYELTLSSKAPVYVQLSEMYAPGWKAIVNGTEEIHYTANSFLNGFYLSAGVYLVVIEYYGQNTKNLTVAVSAGTWLFLLACPLLIFRRRLRPSTKGS
jgi:hypothetical protein